MGLDPLLSPLYPLLSLEVRAGVSPCGENIGELLKIASIGNAAIKDFLRGELTWDEVLEILNALGIDPIKYQEEIAQNFRERGMAWLL